MDRGQFEEAVQLLEELSDEYPRNFQVLNNLGYAYFMIDDLANSILNYERALKLYPRNQEVKEAIKMVRTRLPNQVTEIPDFVLLRMYRSLVSIMSSSSWAILQIAILAGTVIFLFYILFRKNGVRWTPAKSVILSILVLMVLLSGLFGYHKGQYEQSGWSAINMKFQSLYEAPDERSNPVTDIGPGNKLYILDSLGTWYKVQLTDKDVGWLKIQTVDLI